MPGQVALPTAPNPTQFAVGIRRGDHNIDCKIDGVGAMQLNSELVKKS